MFVIWGHPRRSLRRRKGGRGVSNSSMLNSVRDPGGQVAPMCHFDLVFVTWGHLGRGLRCRKGGRGVSNSSEFDSVCDAGGWAAAPHEHF